MKNIFKKIILIVFSAIVLTSCAEFFEGFNIQEECETHSYTSTVTMQPTCLDEGVAEKTCTVCGHKEIDILPALGHTSDLVEGTFISPTCNRKGYSGDYKCRRCGVITEVGHEINYGEHTFTSQITTQPTCTATGVLTKTCSFCGKKETETIPATGHIHSSLDNSTVVEATAQHNGYSGDYKCDVCGVVTSQGHTTYYSACTNHSYSKTLNGDDIIYTCSSCGDSYSKPRYENVTVYGINDYHGQINGSSNGYGPTLGQIGTYLYNVGREDNTLTIDSGDTWQGSLESNYNRGQCINDVMTYAKLSARTIGNHDFDWGISQLETNSASSYQGYKIPVLAGNVYDFDFDSKEVGTTHQDNIGKEYVTYTLKNGLKVGIIGVIGADQITSISTNNVKSIIFTDEITTLKDFSDKLRNEEGCDIVIGSVHSGQETLLNCGLTNVSNKSNKKYLDLVLCAHTHQKEATYENNTLFIQAGSNGYQLGHVVLTYDRYYENISDTNYDYISSTDLKKVNVNNNISNIINTYAQQTNSIGSTVIVPNAVGSFSQSSSTGGVLPNLMCEAIYYEAVKQGYEIDYAYCNNARANISGDSWNMSQLYTAFPFDNVIYVCRVTGTSLEKELKYNFFYRNDTEPISKSKTYTIAVLDYLVWHTNADRYYDYFPGAVEIGYLKKNNEIFNYRDILTDYLISNYSSKTLYSNSYKTSNNPRFDKSLIYESVTF